METPSSTALAASVAKTATLCPVPSAAQPCIPDGTTPIATMETKIIALAKRNKRAGAKGRTGLRVLTMLAWIRSNRTAGSPASFRSSFSTPIKARHSLHVPRWAAASGAGKAFAGFEIKLSISRHIISPLLDEEGLWKRINASELRCCCLVTEHHGVVHFRLLQESPHGFPAIVVHRDAEHRETQALVLALKFHEPWDLG